MMKGENKMNDNDYIADYVRECYPNILGMDFAMWRLKRKFEDAMQAIADTLFQVDWGVPAADDEDTE